MVAFLGFFKHDKILVEHFLLGEGNTIDTRHLLALGITAPESTGNAGYLDGLDNACGNEVRTTAKIGEGTLGIGGDGAVFKVLLDVLTLVFLAISLEFLEGIGLRHFATDNGLVFLGEFLHFCLNLREVVL